MTDTEASPDAPVLLITGHISVYRDPDGSGVLAFLADGAPENAKVVRGMPGVMTGPLVTILEGGMPTPPTPRELMQMARGARDG